MLLIYYGGMTRKLSFGSSFLFLPSCSLPLFLSPTIITCLVHSSALEFSQEQVTWNKSEIVLDLLPSTSQGRHVNQV